ncbi:heme NO-binding domain-containing protein [Citreicella sp. C3M06]|uniref:heme NO-binding domain-containing protein n=1 Tax=Citreicella sp. C3M06 TaxID=2841564 RepID=UPI001C0A5C8F|nr:heme NO-binding domain-containing protein [Citreicella sp. C3M06]MBU2963100.1 heme NO-binding domain-containing protein [Citreicella sp. C3M06]
MKGVIFVELIKMAEQTFGEDAVDTVLEKAELENGGAFTTVGNYPCSELVKIVLAFSDHSGLSPDALQRAFGNWMMGVFLENYPEFFVDKTSAFAMLEAVDQEVHFEVKKLYPEAELPRFDTRRHGDNRLEMIYSSPRPLDAFCEGLIEACLAHFGEEGSIRRVAHPDTPTSTTFDITLTGERQNG